MADKNINSNNDPAKHALRISLLYLLYGSVWIIISDIFKTYTESETFIHLSTDVAKGLLFIAITAFLLYLFLKKYFTNLQSKQAELIESEMQFKSLSERVNIGIIKQAIDGTYIYMNPMAKVIFRDFLKIDEDTYVTGLKPEDIYRDKDFLSRVNETINYVSREKKKLLRKTKYGNKYFSITTYPEFDANNNILSILSIIIDETEIMENMIKLEESERFNSHLVNTTNIIVYLYDITAQKGIFINKAFEKLLGYSNEEIQSHKPDFISYITHPEDAERFAQYQKNTLLKLNDSENSEFEYRMKHKNGNYLWFRSNDCIFKRDEAGNPSVILGSAIDVTDLKTTQEELFKKSDYQKSTIEISPIAIYDIDTKGNIFSIWNKAAENLYGWKAEEVIGNKLPILKQEKEEEFNRYFELLKSGQIINGLEVVRHRKDGSPINVRIHARPMYGKDGKVDSVLAFGEDLTLENKLKESTRENEKYLKLLYEIGLMANNTFDINEFFLKGFNVLREVIDVNILMISSITSDGNYIKCDSINVNGIDVNPAELPLLRIKKNGGGIQSKVIQTGKSIIIENEKERNNDIKSTFIDTDGKICSLDDGVDTEVPKSTIFIPLKIREKVIGVLQLQSFKKSNYIESDILKLEPFAFIFASVINRIRLYNKLQNELAEKAAAFDQVRKFSKGIEQSPNSIVITNSNTEIEYVNPYFTELTGYSLEEILGKNPGFLQSGHTTKEIYGELWKKLLNKEVWHGEFLNRKKNGELFWEAASIGPILDNAGKVTHYIAIKQDISEKKKKDKVLNDTLYEKEIMLKEIHHRVKNNLQVISSLLNMQVEQYEHPEAIDAINSSRNRVKAMALVHESLYQSKNIGKTDFKEYILKLAKNIYSSYGVSMEKVKLNINSNSIEFGLDTIIPLGLILNEAISNCLKHAFPGDSTGEISLDLTSEKIEEDESGRCENFRLEIKDTGKGLPDDFDPYKTNSLGMTLLTSLSSQLDGEAFFINGSGTKIVINFKELTYRKRM